MEYLQQQAELNYMLAVLKDLKMQTINQKALLARVTMVGKDKALDGLADSIHIDYNPNFMDVALEAEGDEWVGGGNTTIMDNISLPTDIEGIKNALLQVIFLGESANNENGWNASNNGTIGKNIVCSRASGGVWNLTDMTLSQMKRVYRRSGQNSPKHLQDCSRLFAAGRYQIIYTTFLHAQRVSNISDSAKFTPEIQTKMAEALLMYRIGDFLRGGGKQSLKTAKIRLSQEWASLGMPDEKCSDKNRMRGYHGGANGAKCDVTYKVWALLEQAEKINNSRNQP